MRAPSQLVAIAIAGSLSACGLGAVAFTPRPVEIGGTVTGLDGAGLVLTNNGSDDLAISGNGTFAFTSPMEHGVSYAVTMKSQPSNPTQLCTVAHGTGTTADEDVTDVQVSCRTATFSVGGTVTGLAGSGLVLQNSHGDDLVVRGDGSFAFATPIASGSAFEVSVVSQPAMPSQTCTVSGGTGTVAGGSVTSVAIECTTNRYTIGGTVTGLVGSGLVLQDNGGDDLAIGADGSFAFATPIASGATFAVTVVSQPAMPSQTCTVSGGTGTIIGGSVTSVAIDCTTNRYTIGGTVTGLAGSGLVVQNSGGDDLAISADGSFAFATPIASGTTFAVTVLTQPATPSQTCAVLGGTGTVGGGNVTSVAINCTTNRYTIGGTISGLVGTVTLRDNGGDDLDVTSNGTFAFATPVPSGASYAVTVAVQPMQPTQVCTVTSGTGAVSASNVMTVDVTCVTSTFTIGGTVTGLVGTGLVLQDDGGDDLAIGGDGSFTFATRIASGSTFAVTVRTQPAGPSQTCTVGAGTGTVGGGNVTSVAISCTTNRYTIGGTISGLVGTVTLRDNGGDDLAVLSNGTFAFATPVPSGASYNVTVAAQPALPAQVCTVIDGTGTVVASNVTSVTVTCVTSTFTIGGTVAGLVGSGLVLQDNGGDDLAITGDGSFAFTTPIASGSAFAVTVRAQPVTPSQTCTVSDGTGTVGGGTVTSVAITCTTNRYTIGGTVTGLVGSGLVLQNSGGDGLEIASDGAFAFATPVASGATYDVTVTTQPTMPSQTCTVTAGAGTVTGADVVSVAVTCTTNRYRVGGTLSGLAAGDAITLRDNGGDDLALSADGSFTFSTQVASGQPYAVTVAADPTSPVAQTCTVASGAGIVAGSDVTSVRVLCTTNAYTIGGAVSGLTGAGLVLQDNAGDDLAITGSGAFVFATPVASGATYRVTVKTQPSNQTCAVAGGTGTVGASNVTSVQVTCVTLDWSTSLFPIAVPGTNFGLGDLALDNNGDLLVVVSTPANAIVRVNHLSGAMTTVATGIGTGSFLLGVAYRAANDMIYTSTSTGQIFAVTPTGTVTLLTTIAGDTINAITIAPPSFAGFEGFIIGVTQLGSVIAVNPVDGAVTTITTGAGAASDLVFAPDGTLYICGGATVRTVTATGVVTPFAAGLSSADGITITPDGARMFIADSGTDTVRQVTIPGAVVTTFGSADIDNGFGVGGILAAPGNTLIVMTGESNLTLRAFAY